MTEPIEKAKNLALQIKEELGDGSIVNRNNVENLAHELFFNTFPDDDGLGWVRGATVLDRHEITNRVGESDSFGPLSWGILVPEADPKDEASWIWFG